MRKRKKERTKRKETNKQTNNKQHKHTNTQKQTTNKHNTARFSASSVISQRSNSVYMFGLCGFGVDCLLPLSLFQTEQQRLIQLVSGNEHTVKILIILFN